MNIPTYLSGAIFAKAQRALRGAVVSSLKRNDLSPTAWTFLGVVATSPDGIRLVELADRLGVKAPLITLIANGMIERGFIKRIPHPTDKRAKLLVMTQSGKKFIARVETEVNGSLEGLLDGLRESDLNTYKKVLETIARNAEARE